MKKADLIGLTYEEAESKCVNSHTRYRLVMKDKRAFVVTHDFVPDRLNLEVEEGIVIKITNG